MSLILDALNKSEQERSERSNPVNIHTVHPPVSDESKRRRTRRWLLEALVIGLVLLAFYLFNQFAGRPAAVEPATAVSQVKPVPVKSEPAPRVAVEAPAGGPVSPPASRIEPDPAEESVAESSAAIRQLYEKPDSTAVTVKPSQVASPKTVVPVVAPAPVPAPVPVDQNAQWINVPLISQLSETSRSRITSIDFSMHIYSDQPGASFVELNGVQLGEGDEVAPGLRVVKIFEYGVILDYQGTQFRLLPLSGWINM